MVLPAALATIFLLLRCTLTEPPVDFPGDETPYRVIPTGTVSPNNIRATYLYGYVDCNKSFGSGAKGKLNDAYYDAWLISKSISRNHHIHYGMSGVRYRLGPRSCTGVSRCHRAK
ncbi:hypothetical protein BDV37DRAFT_109732 [Aspergillus pseudonomiae]|uniref:Uncharacterized protein n=1 Tax=Aspergillus pseudonomiae TaxID=1506151 RepID=A0A5N7DS56_9EURO|nr:uncharacterized protein BDV37DRAFT_109732 [Aspergillus pseudonomiae]KAE8409216.1 hypothetical protein BDV37DRAFT_109732 [Aspergillus pseudonomiae]